MTTGLFIAASISAISLFAYSTTCRLRETSGVFCRLKPLIGPIAIVLVAGATIYAFYSLRNSQSDLLLLGKEFILSVVLSISAAIFIFKRYIAASYETQINELRTPIIKTSRKQLKEAMDMFIKNKEYLNSNLTKEDVAKSFGTNKTYLIAYLRETSDETFPEWLQNLRLNHAINLMRHVSVNVPIKEIALNSGFTSTNPFNTLFKKKYGLSPGKWREEFIGPRHKPYDLNKIKQK